MYVRHRRVFRVGSSLVLTVPVNAPFEVGDELYVYTDGCAIVYSRTPPRVAKELHVVKVRRMGKCRDERCYKIVVIPRAVARLVGIESGDYVEVDVDGDKLVVTKMGGCKQGTAG